MAFKLKSGNRPVFKQMGSSPLNYNSPLKQDKDGKGKIIYKDGKKYYKASDGTLHTGQVSDYEAELAEDKKGVGSGSNRKVMKDGSKNKVHGVKNPGNWQPANRAKSDAEKKIEAKKKQWENMTPEQKKAAQDAANAKRKAFEATDEYKKRRAINDEKERKANAKKK